MFKLKRIRDSNLSSNPFIHHICISLINGHTFFSKCRGVVDGYVVEFRVCLPVFVENEEKLLGPTEGKDGDETSTTSFHDTVNQTCELEDEVYKFRLKGLYIKL